MKFLGVVSGIGLFALFSAVFWFAPKLEHKAAFHKFENDVREFGEIYRLYQKNNGRPPNSMEELQPFVNRAALTTRDRVKNNEFTVAWGTMIDPEIPESRQRCVIVAKPVVNGQQVVIHQDGSVRHYSPEETAKLIMATVPESSTTAQ